MTLVLLATLVSPVAAAPEQPCEVVPMPCTFEGLPFKLTVIDAETRKPLADVHALAEWRLEGAGGRANGPLMVQDAVSGADGQLSFEAWGPIEGLWTGLVIGSDPVITLFKSGYKTVLLNNGYRPPARERERVRRFIRKDTTFALEPFRGSPDQWLEELAKVLGAPRTDPQSLQFRDAYLNRFRRISAERDRLPPPRTFEGSFFWHIDRTLKLLQDGHR